MSPARRATPCSRGSACRCSSPRSACRTLLPLECAFTLGARMFKEDLLKGKRILITGGGTGLGKEIAARYLELGAELWLAGRRGPVLDACAKELMSKFGGTVRTHSVDIRDAAAVDAMIQRIWDESGPLTGLVNNAAGNFISPTKDLSPNGFNAIANIVFHGTFYVTHAVGKRWIAGGHKGSVVSILVTWVHTGSPYVVPSAMSKAGLHVMTKSLAVEWGRYGIRLNAIAPGPFPTEGATKRLRPDGGFQDSSQMNPMRRVGKMEELQNLATFLMADGCEWLTGETIAVDGGGYLATGSGGYFTELDRLSDADWDKMRAMIKAQNDKDRAGRTA